jgi:hypothetical protein
MYDLDRKDTEVKLALCKSSISIASNPAVELWFLLHIEDQHAAISTDDCIDKLKKSTPDWAYYKKGSLTEKQKQVLWDNRGLASVKAKKLSATGNPASLVYRLIEDMDSFIG